MMESSTAPEAIIEQQLVHIRSLETPSAQYKAIEALARQMIGDDIEAERNRAAGVIWSIAQEERMITDSDQGGLSDVEIEILDLMGDVPELLSARESGRDILHIGLDVLDDCMYMVSRRISARSESSGYKAVSAQDIYRLSTLHFLHRQCEYALLGQKNEETEELDRFLSDEARYVRAADLSKEVALSFDQIPPPEGVDRDQIVTDALASFADFVKGKGDENALVFAQNLVRDKRILFLSEEDYLLLNESLGGSEERKGSTAAFTYFGGFIVINQEAILDTIQSKGLEKNVFQNHVQYECPNNMGEASVLMNKLSATYVPYLVKEGQAPTDEPGPIDQQAVNDALKEILWGAIFHEALHIATTNNCFGTRLDEDATHYYTAFAALKNRGFQAFDRNLRFSDLPYVLDWLSFIRRSGLGYQTESWFQEIYFNADKSWTYDEVTSVLSGEENAALFIRNLPYYEP